MKNKIKLLVEPGSSKLVFLGKKGQQISESEVHDINNGEIACLIKLEVEKKKNKFKLFFNINDLCTLEEFLEDPIKKKTFSKILYEMTAAIQTLNDANYNLQRVFLSYDKVFISAATHEIFFIYVPVQGFDAGGNVHDFFHSLVQQCKFSGKENNDYVKEYVQIFNDSASFSIFDVKTYLEKINSKPKKIINCPFCGAEVVQGATYCPECAHRIEIEEEPKAKVEPKQKTSVTTESRIVEPLLIRSSNNEAIKINTEVFIIGRQPDVCHYCISENQMLGRKHACIISRERGYFVMDLNSLNKTLLNGSVIPSATEVEINDGDELTFANEKFTFIENNATVMF